MLAAVLGAVLWDSLGSGEGRAFPAAVCFLISSYFLIEFDASLCICCRRSSCSNIFLSKLPSCRRFAVQVTTCVTFVRFGVVPA